MVETGFTGLSFLAAQGRAQRPRTFDQVNYLKMLLKIIFMIEPVYLYDLARSRF
jgi:hypothetical protein